LRKKLPFYCTNVHFYRHRHLTYPAKFLVG
jgi:hypothetical protein